MGPARQIVPNNLRSGESIHSYDSVIRGAPRIQSNQSARYVTARARAVLIVMSACASVSRSRCPLRHEYRVALRALCLAGGATLCASAAIGVAQPPSALETRATHASGEVDRSGRPVAGRGAIYAGLATGRSTIRGQPWLAPCRWPISPHRSGRPSWRQRPRAASTSGGDRLICECLSRSYRTSLMARTAAAGR
jgi:hypothetical protein